MGNCSSNGSDAKKKDKEIDDYLATEGNKYDREIKLLLLGSGESGKSTLAKQMKIIHLNGFTDEERSTFKVAIYNNVVTSARALAKAAADFGIVLQDEEAANLIKRPEYEVLYGPITPEMTKAIKTLLTDPGIAQTMTRYSEFQLLDSAQYFFDNLDRITDRLYVPTVKDVLMSRTKTTGVSEMEFNVGKTHFRMVDVGGQRSERKKWMHCFQDVTAVLFVVALSEYDLKLYEDNSTNRMFESLKLFKEICNSPWLANTAVILFLNKSDLFRQKIAKVDLNVCFPEYKAGPNFLSACEFVQEKFLSLNTNPSKPIYPHTTCATDTENITVVFNAVKDIIIRNVFQGGGARPM